MSTPEQPLTRKKLRELHATGSLPVQGDATETHKEGPGEGDSAAPPAAPLPRAATPAFSPPAPIPDAHVDLGVSPLTRRQAREQERIRTASVPVITPDVAAARGPVSALGAPASPRGSAPVIARAPHAASNVAAGPEASAPASASRTDEVLDGPHDVAEAGDAPEQVTVDPTFGSHLLSDDGVSVELPASFDELIVRNTSPGGGIGASNALILSQTPDMSSLSGPVNATGEVLITGTFHLPRGLGSGAGDPHATDGKDVDAVLVDGELAASSSPTPIAASAAISTVRGTGEIIRPPAPEKGNRLLFSLAITAGVLALALVGVLVFAVVNGTI